MRSRLGTWTSTAASAGRRLPKRCREAHRARSSAGTGGSTTADITRGPERVPSPGTSMLAPCPATRCATATSTRWRTACSCSCGTLPMTISSAGLIGNWGRWIPNLLTGSPALREAIIGPLRNVYGVADKVLAMALSSLLLGAGKRRPLWVEVGATFVAVDTLVHNFLHRTGILRRLCADHPYGDRCYRPGGCAGILGLLAANIDARAVQSGLPGDVSAVRAERDLAVLRRERPRRLQRQSHRRRHPLRQRALPAVSPL